MADHRSMCESWLDSLAQAVRYQWLLLDAQYRVGIELAKAMSAATSRAAPGREDERPAARGVEDWKEFERRAAERARRGLSPPKEIYQVQNRNRVDWLNFPEWARPIDPEVFAGAGHEG
jgi:hypothetical protein